MVMVYKATPRPVLKGIRDLSGASLTTSASETPQHLPIYFLLTEKSQEVSIVNDDTARVIYGDKTFDPLSEFFTHQTLGANLTFNQANQAMIVPIKMEGARRSSIRIGVELVAATVDGVNKTRLIWHATPIPKDDTEPFSHATVKDTYRQGNTVSEMSNTKLGALIEDGVEYYAPSAYFPLIDLEAEAPGAYGDSLAIAIEAPTILSPNPTDAAILKKYNTFVYRLTLLRKNSVGSSPSAIYNKYNELTSDFVMKPDFVNTLTRSNMSFGEVITEYYQDVDSKNTTPTYSPFSNVAVYQDNFEMVSRMIGAGYDVDALDESLVSKNFVVNGLYATEAEAEENIYAINLFTAEDALGKPYPTIDISNSRKFGGTRFGRDSIIYAQGGDDAFPKTLGVVDKLATLERFDNAVRDWCDNFNDVNPLFDSARYPFGKIWDTGFSIPTKLSLMKPVGQHKRIAATVSTHAIADYANSTTATGWHYKAALTGAEEVAVGVLLRSAGLLIPESLEFSTPTVRIAICSRSGKMVNPQYRGRYPLTLELIDKVSAYFGSADGILNSKKAFDVHPNNRVNLMRDINITYQSGNVYNNSWDAGIMWVQHDDPKTTFFPAFRTIYPDDTSVLTSYVTMLCICYIERVCEVVWRKLVGNGKLTDAEFIEESDKLLAQELNGKFDNRFKIVPRTYYTAFDEMLGTRWSTSIDFYASNMKTVGQYTLTSRRASDYLNTTP